MPTEERYFYEFVDRDSDSDDKADPFAVEVTKGEFDGWVEANDGSLEIHSIQAGYPDDWGGLFEEMSKRPLIRFSGGPDMSQDESAFWNATSRRVFREHYYGLEREGEEQSEDDSDDEGW